MALSAYEFDCILTWLKYCRIMSDDTHRRYINRLDLDDLLRADIVREQSRRVRELMKLEKAVQTELDSMSGKGAAADAP